MIVVLPEFTELSRQGRSSFPQHILYRVLMGCGVQATGASEAPVPQAPSPARGSTPTGEGEALMREATKPVSPTWWFWVLQGPSRGEQPGWDAPGSELKGRPPDAAWSPGQNRTTSDLGEGRGGPVRQLDVQTPS